MICWSHCFVFFFVCVFLNIFFWKRDTVKKNEWFALITNVALFYSGFFSVLVLSLLHLYYLHWKVVGFANSCQWIHLKLFYVLLYEGIFPHCSILSLGHSGTLCVSCCLNAVAMTSAQAWFIYPLLWWTLWRGGNPMWKVKNIQGILCATVLWDIKRCEICKK